MKTLSENEMQKVTQLIKQEIANLNQNIQAIANLPHDIKCRQREIVGPARKEYRQTKKELEVILKKLERKS